MNRSVTIRLGAFASEALAGGPHGTPSSVGPEPNPDDVLRAIRFYLNDKDGGGAGWGYPEFLRGTGLGGKVDLELTIENSLWRSLKKEAENQGVSVDQLVEHAALYYAAELDAGHVAERMLGESGKG
ncbi:MAG: hypothetical protein QOF13_2326 [Solirubrobacterales bacterium]|nr:hypothetical protein [Solirubrobacterales bacterium]